MRGLRPEDRPRSASTAAGWLRQLSRAMALLIIVVLVALLFRAGREALAEGEQMALDMAEQNLEDLVWLEARRALAEEGVEGLRRRAGGDPRTWAQDRIGTLRPDDLPTGPLPEWAGERWYFDARRGELVYRPVWMSGGERRWRVELQQDGVDSPTPGLARDLLVVRIRPPDACR